MLTTLAPPAIPLPEIVRTLEERLERAGVLTADMRRAGSLETDMNIPQLTDGSELDPFAPHIAPLEDPFVTREIARRNETRFTWFLDGSQKTLPVWRIGVVPVVVGIAIVGILERDQEGMCHLLGDSLVEQLRWLVPRQTTSPQLNSLIDILEEAGEVVTDPLRDFAHDPDNMGQYHALAGSYNHLLHYSQKAAGTLRGLAEERVARFWDDEIRYRDPAGWLVIDGRLNGDYEQAVGVIKDPATPYLTGDDAAGLYGLPHGWRTAAFQAEQHNLTYTMWYQRMWPATGLDARHALIRVDTNADVIDPQEIDDIATWLMAERVPRPTKDGRWPTLLYPIHQLEMVLKRRIRALTVGWPV